MIEKDDRFLNIHWYNIEKLKRNFLPWVLALSACVWGGFLFLNARKILGPAIFGDELAYFSFARTIFFGKNLSTFTQYGPLYPLLIATFFLAKNTIVTYQFIKVFNIIVFISAIIPAYLIAKELFSNLWLRILLPLFVLFSPFSSFVFLIWAEPLYITLFYWNCYLLLKFSKNPTIKQSIVLAIFISSLYYTKPAAGLVLYVAIFFTLLTSLILKPGSSNKKIWLYFFILIFMSIAFDLPMMLHYLHLGVSIIGYPGATNDLTWQITHQNHTHLLLTFIASLFYQFSYVFIGTWGMFGVCMVLIITTWHRLSNAEKNLTLFLIFSLLGLMVLSAIGMVSYRVLDYRMPQGRYFSLLLPIVTVISLHLIINKTSSLKEREYKLGIYSILITFLIAIIASPLYTRNPVAFTSMPELSPIIYLINKGLVNWGPLVKTPKFNLRCYVPLFFGSMALIIFLCRKGRYTPFLATTIIFIGTLLASLAEEHYLFTITSSQSPLSKIYIYLMKHHINFDAVAFDKKLAPGNVQFLTPFWLDRAPSYDITKATFFISNEKLTFPVVYAREQYIIYQTNNTNYDLSQ